MAPASRLRLLLLVAIAAMALFGACATTVPHQTIAPIEPTNDLPNPYQTIAPWGKLPEGRKWGALNGVAIDNDGESVWVADRCGVRIQPIDATDCRYRSAGVSYFSVFLGRSFNFLATAFSLACE